MAVKNPVIGKQYRYTAIDHGGVDWFVAGSIVTINSSSINGKDVKATGAAKTDNIGGKIVKEGQEMQGWVRFDSLEELESPAEPAAVHVSLNGNSTTIVVQRNLTADEVAAVLKIVNK